MRLFHKRPKIYIRGLPRETVAKVHVSWRVLNNGIMGGMLFYALIFLFFLIKGWHIPDQMQKWVNPAIFIPCQYLAMWLFYRRWGFRTAGH